MPPDPTFSGGKIPTTFRTARTVDQGHGGRDTRQITASSALNDHSDCAGLVQVFQIEREDLDPITGNVSREIIHGLSSPRRTQAVSRRRLHLVRSYWGIQDGLHHRRYSTFRGIAIRLAIAHSGRVIAILNNLFISVSGRSGFTNLAQARGSYLWQSPNCARPPHA